MYSRRKFSHSYHLSSTPVSVDGTSINFIGLRRSLEPDTFRKLGVVPKPGSGNKKSNQNQYQQKTDTERSTTRLNTPSNTTQHLRNWALLNDSAVTTHYRPSQFGANFLKFLEIFCIQEVCARPLILCTGSTEIMERTTSPGADNNSFKRLKLCEWTEIPFLWQLPGQYPTGCKVPMKLTSLSCLFLDCGRYIASRPRIEQRVA